MAVGIGMCYSLVRQVNTPPIHPLMRMFSISNASKMGESWWDGGHEIEGSVICLFRATDMGEGGFIGRHLIKEALHLILVLPTWCVKIVYTVILSLIPLSGVSVRD